MKKIELYELRALAIYSRTNPRIGKELEEIKAPLMNKFMMEADKIQDPVLKLVIKNYYTGTTAREMGLLYGQRHIYKLIEKAEKLIINEQ